MRLFEFLEKTVKPFQEEWSKKQDEKESDWSKIKKPSAKSTFDIKSNTKGDQALKIINEFKRGFIQRYTLEINNANGTNPEKISLADIAVENFISSLTENLLLRNDVEINVLNEASVSLGFTYGSQYEITFRTDVIDRPESETREMKSKYNIDSTKKLKLNIIKIDQDGDDVTKTIKKESKLKFTTDSTGFIDIIKYILDKTNEGMKSAEQ